MGLAIVDTGKTTTVVDAGSVLTKNVYEVTDTVEVKKKVNVWELTQRKAELEKELAKINDILGQVTVLDEAKAKVEVKP